MKALTPLRSLTRRLTVLVAVWAVLGQALIPAFHHHDTKGAGWHQQKSDQDDDDDCPICQAIQAIGVVVLPGAPSAYDPLPRIMLAARPESSAAVYRHRTDRPRQRAPPSVI